VRYFAQLNFIGHVRYIKKMENGRQLVGVTSPELEQLGMVMVFADGRIPVRKNDLVYVSGRVSTNERGITISNGFIYIIPRGSQSSVDFTPKKARKRDYDVEGSARRVKPATAIPDELEGVEVSVDEDESEALDEEIIDLNG